MSEPPAIALRRLRISARRYVVPWRFVLITSYIIVNVILALSSFRPDAFVSQDWALWNKLSERLAAGNLYQIDGTIWFVWSPLMAPVMIGATMMGYWAWVAAHIAAVLLLRSPLLIALMLVSYGFWIDTAHGNTLTFVLVAGLLALQGGRVAALAYLALLILMPRPLQIPLGVWLVWRDRSLLWPFVAMVLVHGAIVLATGYAVPWLTAMLAYDGPAGWTFGPTAYVGVWWLVLGIPLAIWLTWRGHVGWAGLAVNHYLLVQYLMWPLLELNARRRHGGNANPSR